MVDNREAAHGLTPLSTTAQGGARSAAVRNRLRRETETQHRRLHSLLPFVALADGTLSRSGYIDLLLNLYVFHAGIEALTDVVGGRFSAAFGGYEPAQRSKLLAHDLERLGAVANPYPRALQLAAPTCAQHLCGMLYVVDGSMLGAAVLEGPARHIAGPDGTEFWSWSRAHGGRRWRRLCDCLTQLSDGADGDRIMVETAQATFAAFEAVFLPQRAAPFQPVQA